ncbi:NAD(P)-binding protein [Lophiostoma macrostomum CBS 122681]|uniref:NAD(P)-binding protein n=1 Tax=Lophiostoma macrostomum CBS 122681 TaxID=1314788 RepID=A0A6A6TDG6_9PLEO|nr:NAD(P)-binding protein [Lophiostoma macrostomum CBS 122681]
MASQTTTQHRPLAGKVAIVTGASRGIGVSLALELARRGAKITVVYTSANSESLAGNVVKQIEQLGSQAVAVQADLSQIDAGEKVVSRTVAAFGSSIHILVNNAGVEFDRSLLETSAEDFAKIFDVNVRGTLLMTKAVVPHLQAPGRIINMSSVGARSGLSKLALYCASKAAVEGLTRCLAAELGELGHTVNTVAPGPTESEMLDNVPKDIVDVQLKTTPVEHRAGKPDDIAQIVAWLAEEQSRWISGQTISASGGFLML